MAKVNIIDCKTEDVTKTYLFALFILNKSIIGSIINVFKDLNI